MAERETTWAEVGPGVLLQDPNLKHWLVVDEAADGLGQRWLRIMSRWKEFRSVLRRPDPTPVVIVEASEDEAVQAVVSQLGGHHLAMFADDLTVGRRAARWVMDPINTKGRGAKERIRDHIDMHHGVYVNDGWTNKKTPELVQAHDEMHADETLTMLMPHVHKKEAS